MKVSLFTRQHIKSLSYLEKDGIFYAKREFLEEKFGDLTPFFENMYQYFNQEAEKRVSRPPQAALPIWCSISKEYCLQPIEDTVVYELLVDERKVIYFDGLKWDYVLNHHYVPKDPEDLKRYESEMRKKGFSEIDEYSFFISDHLRLCYDEKQEIKQSWKRIFDIEEWTPYNV